ncbi:MAG TPA: alpha/beta hydrolase [Patescibacteria group bacterium]
MEVIMVHGWSGTPSEGWFPWLKKELEIKGFKVQIPEMPDTDNPKIGPWVRKLSEVVGTPSEILILVGHSVGCQTILRYLESLPTVIKIRGIILVAPFFTLTLDENEEEEIARPWLETPIDYQKVKSRTNKIVAIFSDNDPFVSLENVQMFEQRLNSKTIVEKNKGHFSGDDGVNELPVVLKAIEEISTSR